MPCSTFANMNRRRIILIITLVSLALITLVAIQLYWINSAIKVEESHFQRNVNEAAGNIAYKLQKMDLAHEFSLQQRSDRIMRSLDSLSYAYYMQMINDSVNPSSYVHSNQNRAEAQEIEESYRQQSSMLNELFEEMISSRNPFRGTQRYNKNVLDSLISLELANKGIRTDFEFGIFSSIQNRLLMEKTGNFTQNLLEEGFVYPLSPDNMLISTDYLVLYFPRQMHFMLIQLTGMLAVSILIVLILIGTFYYAIHTIIRQKKLSVMKTDFINNMTHEFKTPISTVALACEALSDKDIQKSENLYKNYISIISEENRRLGVMAEKILQTAILEKGDLKLRPELFDLHETILEVVKTMSIQVEIRDGQIITGLQAAQSMLHADKVHITNILTNLLDNANKYTPNKPRIEVSTSNVQDGIVLTIADNGVGISKQNQKKIFEKLYRVPTGNIHNVKGYGLGLSYVKFIIDKHKGSISIESEPGQGTRFRVFLPFGN